MAIELADKEKLTKEQKQAIGILSFGTFLEYFDLMLYIHMAVLLNDLFFSKTDAFSAQLLSAFSFCATFVFRPIGAMFIGYIGDVYGRKSTIILTTTMMSICCLIMANLPTYDQVGITASIAVTLCRIFQGMSSMGEKTGAEIYLTELVKPPKVYPVVALISIATSAGAFAAIFIADLSISSLLNWRVAFLFGALIAFLGIFARSKLRETPDFADAKRELYKLCDRLKIDKEKLKGSLAYTQKINKKSAISYFLIQLANPVYFYFIYIHCSNILKNELGCTAAEVISQNLTVALIGLIGYIFLIGLLYLAHPLKILKISYYVTIPIILLLPLMLNNVTTKFEVLIIQIIIMVIPPTEFLAAPIFYKSFPVFKRFTGACLSYAVARAVMYVISSFGMVYLVKYFGNLGLLFIFVPMLMFYGYGLFHFLDLEKSLVDK